MTGASRILTGLVTCLATQDGIPAVARGLTTRYNRHEIVCRSGLVLAALLPWLTNLGDTS